MYRYGRVPDNSVQKISSQTINTHTSAGGRPSNIYRLVKFKYHIQIQDI